MNTDPLFPLGRIIVTLGALNALKDSAHRPEDFLLRHVHGDWGEVCPEDRAENELSVLHGYRILSAYTTKQGQKLWLITEADRSVTTLLLPDEY